MIKNKDTISTGQLSTRCIRGKRLLWYKTRASAEYWDSLWQATYSNEMYIQAEKGHLGYFSDIFRTYLPSSGRILEAGCGLGQYVIALRSLGYEIEGVEWGNQTVEFVNKMKPDIPVRWGEVTVLDVPDNWYAGYISLGVIEHRYEGPEPFLKEASRVLQPGGVALISVPHFNKVRRFKARLGFIRDKAVERLDFYQYAFTELELKDLLETAGFEVVDWFHYSSLSGTKEDLPWLHAQLQSHYLRKARSWFYSNDNRMVIDLLGHMTMAICRKR